MAIVALTARDAGCWMGLIPIGKELERRNIEVIMICESGSVAAKKLEQSLSKGIISHNISASELVDLMPINVVVSGMASTLGRMFAKNNEVPVMGIPTIPGESFNHWEEPPLELFVSTEAEVSQVAEQWKGKARAFQTGYPYLDTFFHATREINRAHLRSSLNIQGPLVWIAGDKEDAPEMMELTLQAIEQLGRSDIVVFPNVHPGASPEDKRRVDEVLGRFKLKYVSADDFPTFESRFIASDVVVATVHSTMLIQARHAGASAIGLGTPRNLEKLEFYCGTRDLAKHPLIAGSHIATADTFETLAEVLARELVKSDLAPLPPLDGNAAKRVVDRICWYL